MAQFTSPYISKFQLTRPRGTRPENAKKLWDWVKVSTHASAGDATALRNSSRPRSRVSTHASAGDATSLRLRAALWAGVSTHASAGDATEVDVDHGCGMGVSTHASAGDATGRAVYHRPRPGFNSRVRGGRDDDESDRTDPISGFNSRVRGGRDPVRPAQPNRRKKFQLTRPRGTRHAADTLERYCKVSTHASAGDATVVRKDVFMIALFRYFARRLRFGAFHDAQCR